MKAAAFAILAVCLFVLPGCSTIVNGKHQALIINSNPPGATFQVDGITGVTPGTANVERGRNSHVVVINKPGYQPSQHIVTRKVNPWIVGNVFIGGGLLGMFVDAVSGGAYELRDDHVHATLLPDYGIPTELPPQQISAANPRNVHRQTQLGVGHERQEKFWDQRLAKDVSKALRDADLRGYDIGIEVTEGTTKLTGEVVDTRQRELASNIAAKVRGVRKIDNRLIVTPLKVQTVQNRMPAQGIQLISATDGAPLTNHQMAERVAHSLRNAGLNGFDLQVRFEDGDVTIGGTVATPDQRATITQVVSKTAGVESIHNEVVVARDAAGSQPVTQAQPQSIRTGNSATGRATATSSTSPSGAVVGRNQLAARGQDGSLTK